MTATRLPVRSQDWSQCAEWKAGPANRSAPGISGIDGTCSAPMPDTIARAVYISPDAVATCQRPLASSHSMRSTGTPYRIWPPIP